MVHGLESLDPRTPVLVAVGQSEQHTDDVTAALEPTALLADAARSAVASSGSDRVLDAVDTIAVVQILSHAYRDPGALVAAELGLATRRTILTDEGGNYAQSLLNRACREISAGDCDGWLIGGSETWRTRQASMSTQTPVAWTHQGADVRPTAMVTNGRQIFSEGEARRGLIAPSTFYALFENALRAARGWTIDEHRDRLAQLYAGFSAVAQQNPHAWIRRPWTAAQIREATPDNRMVDFPYTKVMNANFAVEQAACIVVTSVERARALGVPRDRWVFPWAGTDAHEHWYVSNRWSLAAAPAIGIAGRGALDLAGIGVDDLAHIDVYSCFPSAVQIAAAEIGLSVDRPLTVTGGLSFAGGPFNNYVSHAIATMYERLRDDEGSMGLVTANGGYLTKHAMGIYSTTPPPSGFRSAHLQDQVDALPSRQAADVVDGPVTVESAAVMHGRDQQPERVAVAVLLDDGRRAWGTSSDQDTMSRFVTEETAGAGGHLGPDGAFRFTS